MEIQFKSSSWWGGQFERMVSFVKSSLYKSVGKSNLKWSELEEVLTDLEVILNNRPLSYIFDTKYSYFGTAT